MAPAHHLQQATLARRLERRVTAEWRWTTALLLTAIFLLHGFGGHLGLNRLDNILHDTLARLAVYRTTTQASDIVIIAIDDNSIESIGFWPWRRRVYATLLDHLHQARAVGMDLLLSEQNPAYPDDDAILANAMSAHGRVVLANMLDPRGGKPTQPLVVFDQATRYKGYINIDVDNDGILRAVQLQRTVDGEAHWHFVPRLLEAAGATSALQHLLDKPQRPLRIPWAGPAGTFTAIPYHQVLERHHDPDLFKDKYVLIGAWSSGLGDVFTTPMTSSGPPMAGVEVLANVLHAGLADRWIQSPSTMTGGFLLLFPVFLACVACRLLSPQRAFLACVLLLATILLVSAALLTWGLWWMGPSAGLLGCSLAYPIWSWRSQHAVLAHINHELSLLDTDMPPRALARAGARNGRASRQTLMGRVAQLHRAIELFRQTRRRRDETIRFLSHDMRAPLNAILALGEMQRQNQASAGERAYVEACEHHARQTLQLVDGLVDLGRAEGKDLITTITDLVDVVCQSCDNNWARARKKNIEIHYPQACAPAWVDADPALLQRAFNNLVDNAIKYSPPDTAVICTVTAGTGVWVAEIRDEGIGIPQTALTELFEPFRRIATEDNGHAGGTVQGAGLGLAFVQTVIHRHKGTIRVTSQPGQGTVFTIELPQVAAGDDHQQG